MSPIMCRSSVLLPHPLPPMMMKMSPLFMTKFRFLWITKIPKTISRFSMTIAGDVPSGRDILDAPLYAENIGDDRKDAVRDDNRDDGGHDRRRCCVADRGGAAAALHAPHTA